MSEGKERQSNIELLRITAMLMIIGSHLACHGVQQCLDPENAYQAYMAVPLSINSSAAF